MIEIGGSEEVAMIRDSHGGHSATRSFRGQFADSASAVEEGVVGVKMKVNKVSLRNSRRVPTGTVGWPTAMNRAGADIGESDRGGTFKTYRTRYCRF